MAKTNMSPPELSFKEMRRFWEKVDRRSPTECWPWKKSRNRFGYGGFTSIHRRALRAHRVAFFLAYRLWPEVVMHSVCDSPPCCNPAHMKAGTHTLNIAERDAKNRTARGDRSGPRLHPERLARGDRHGSRTHPERLARGSKNGNYTCPESVKKGEKNGNAKLTADQVLDIRREYSAGTRITTLARQYGVTMTHVGYIVHRRAWKHLP